MAEGDSGGAGTEDDRAPHDPAAHVLDAAPEALPDAVAEALPDGPPRHARRRASGPWGTVVRSVAAMLVVAVAGAGAVVGALAVDLVRDLDVEVVALPNETVLASAPDIGAMEGGLNFLLIGSDQRPADNSFGDASEDSGILNDVNMLLHISQDHSHVEVVSFPRDLLVSVPPCPDPDDPGATLYALDSVKLNTVLFYGGMSCVVATVEQLTGLAIPAAGVVRFDGVVALSDAVGGVPVCLIDPVEDPDSGLFLDAGEHVIQGRDALAFLRVRHAIGDGSDLGRIANQQTFLASLVRTLQSGGTLGDPVKLYHIARAVIDHITLSKELQNPLRLVAIAMALRDVDLADVTFVQYPTGYNADQSAVVPSDSAALVNQALQEDRPIRLDPSAQDDAEFGTVADPSRPGGPTTEPPADGAEPPADGAEPPADGAAQQLGSDAVGMSAAEYRCATANRG